MTWLITPSLRFDKGKITPLKARLLPVYGTLNVIDDENNEGANIFLDDRLIGKAPLVEYKVRIGKYKVRLVKPGYKMMADYYDATIVQNGAFDLPVALYVSKQIYLVSIPTRANVYLEGAKLEGVKDTLFGSTPFKRILQKGKYTLRFEKSGGFVPEKYYLEIDETSKDNDTIRFPMRKGYPLIIKSETSDLALEIHGLNSGPDSLANIVINQNLKTPAPLNIPFGKYSVILREGNLKRFHGKIKHDPKNIGEIKLPCYSNKSFKPLVADFISTDNFELSFGQSYFFGFTGLSTAIFNVQYFAKKQVDEFGVNTGEKISMLIPNIFLLNWDFRIGGAIMRNLDICALGRIKYTPGLKAADLNIPGYNDATMLTGFYGIELSSRFSYLNINCKAGIQQLSGTCNVWNTNEKKYTEGIKINEMNPVVSFGITINGYISGSNNMLRLWHQPPVNLLKKFAYSKMKRNSKKGAAVGK
ncbi:MAG: PEGA domain-containing protein [Bacteroidia bacterium]|nr:PEGA domain-containing protein [Bacteroidia bacterium]